MKKWYNEEYSFEIEVTGFLRGDHTERYCRNGEEIGDKLYVLMAVSCLNLQPKNWEMKIFIKENFSIKSAKQI